MICELSPYSCMPNTMSIGAMAAVHRQAPRSALCSARDQGRCRGACAVALPDDPDRGQEARADRVRERAVEHRLDTSSRARPARSQSARMKKATYRVPHHGVVGTRPTSSLNWRKGARCEVVGLDVGSTTVKAVLVEDDADCVAGLSAPQHAAGREGSRVPHPAWRANAGSSRPRYRVCSPARARAARAARRRQVGAGGRCRRRGGGEAASRTFASSPRSAART